MICTVQFAVKSELGQKTLDALDEVFAGVRAIGSPNYGFLYEISRVTSLDISISLMVVETLNRVRDLIALHESIPPFSVEFTKLEVKRSHAASTANRA